MAFACEPGGFRTCSMVTGGMWTVTPGTLMEVLTPGFKAF